MALSIPRVVFKRQINYNARSLFGQHNHVRRIMKNFFQVLVGTPNNVFEIAPPTIYDIQYSLIQNEMLIDIACDDCDKRGQCSFSIEFDNLEKGIICFMANDNQLDKKHVKFLCLLLHNKVSESLLGDAEKDHALRLICWHILNPLCDWQIFPLE